MRNSQGRSNRCIEAVPEVANIQSLSLRHNQADVLTVKRCIKISESTFRDHRYSWYMHCSIRVHISWRKGGKGAEYIYSDDTKGCSDPGWSGPWDESGKFIRTKRLAANSPNESQAHPIQQRIVTWTTTKLSRRYHQKLSVTLYRKVLVPSIKKVSYAWFRVRYMVQVEIRSAMSLLPAYSIFYIWSCSHTCPVVTSSLR